MAALTRCTVLSCLVSLLLAQNSIDLGEEPFSSKIVRKTLDNGTIVEYEYLYYYDTEDGEEESIDFEDGLSDDNLLSNPTQFTSATPAVEPISFTTPTPTRFASQTTPSAPVSFSNPAAFSKTPSVTPSRFSPSPPRLPSRPSSPSPITPGKFPSRFPPSPTGFNSPSTPVRFTNSPPTFNIPVNPSVRPLPFPNSFSPIPARPTFHRPRGQTHLAPSPRPPVNVFSPITSTSSGIAEIDNNEVTGKPIQHNASLNRHRNRNRPRISSQNNRNPVTPAFVTEQPLPIPTVQSTASRDRLRTNTVTPIGNEGPSRFFGSRQRGQSIRPEERPRGTTPAGTEAPSTTVKPVTEHKEEIRKVQNIGASRNRFRTNSVRPGTRRRQQRPKPVSATPNEVNPLPVEEEKQIQTAAVAPPRRRGSTRFRTGSANRLTNSITLNSPIVEQNLALGPRRTARRRPIAPNPTVFGRGNSGSSSRASRVIGGGARRQQITTEATTTTTQPRLPQGTRFPPRASSSESSLSGPTVTPQNERVAVSEAGLAGDNLYSLSRVVEPDFQTEQPLLSTIDFNEYTTTDDELQRTTDSPTTDISSTEKMTLKLKKFSHLRPRPKEIVPLKALPAVSTSVETTTDSYTTDSTWPQTRGDEKDTATSVWTTELQKDREETSATVASNIVKQTTTPTVPTTTTTAQTTPVRPGQNSRQTSAIRRPNRLRGSRRRPNRPSTLAEKNTVDEQNTSDRDESINSIGGRQSPFRRTPPRRRPFSPAKRLRTQSSESETISDSENEIAISHNVNNKEKAPVDESPSTSTFRRVQSSRPRTGERRRFRGRPNSRRVQSELNSVKTDTVEDEKSVEISNDDNTEEINDIAKSVKTEDEEQTSPARTRHRHNFRNRRPFSGSKGVHETRANGRPHQVEKQQVTEEIIEREDDTKSVDLMKTEKPLEDVEEDEDENEDAINSAVTTTNKSPLSGRRRRPFRGRTRQPSNRAITQENDEKSKPAAPINVPDDNGRTTFRSRFSKGRSRGRNNVRPRGFLPPTETTEKQIEEVTENSEKTTTATTTTTTTSRTVDEEEKEPEEDDDDDDESEEVDEPRHKQGLRGLSHRRRPAISRFSQQNRPEQNTKQEKDHKKSVGQDAPDSDDDSETNSDDKEDDEEEDTPVVDGERPLRFNTARNAPSVRDSSRNFVSVGRGLFGGGRRPSPFHRTALRHNGGLRGQLTERKVVTHSTAEKTTSDHSSTETPTTLKTAATTTTKKPTTTTQPSFRSPFSGAPRKSLNERRRKFVPGGFRRPPTSGFQALRRNKLLSQKNDAPDEELNKIGTVVEEDNEGSEDMAPDMLEDPTTTTDYTETTTTTTPSPSSTTERSRLIGRRRGGRQTKLSLSDQLRILNG